MIYRYDNVILKSKVYSNDSYMYPPVPPGWKKVTGNWNTGFVIQRESDGSQFVWIPVGFLQQNGTVDGLHFDCRFGRRHFSNEHNTSFTMEYSNSQNIKFINQRENVEKYGGFYVSRHLISNENGKLLSRKSNNPLTNVSWYDAFVMAEDFSFTWDQSVTSHLLYPSEYDSMIQWFIQDDNEQFLKRNEKIKNINIKWSYSIWTQEQRIRRPNISYARNGIEFFQNEKTYRSPKCGFRIALSIY